jgi:hypothetical protein
MAVMNERHECTYMAQLQTTGIMMAAVADVTPGSPVSRFPAA